MFNLVLQGCAVVAVVKKLTQAPQRLLKLALKQSASAAPLKISGLYDPSLRSIAPLKNHTVVPLWGLNPGCKNTDREQQLTAIWSTAIFLLKHILSISHAKRQHQNNIFYPVNRILLMNNKAVNCGQ